ncbi:MULTISPECIES: redoxin family protein [unclassified Lysobacter]
MLSVGPFPISLVVLLVSLVAAVLSARWLHCRTVDGGEAAGSGSAGSASARPGSIIVDMAFIGVVVARVAFIVQWLPQYLEDPWSMVRIGDGGFTLWAGIVAAIGWGVWRIRKLPSLRRPLAAGVVAGLLSWAFLGGALTLLQNSSAALPTTALSTLDGEPTSLEAMSGQPIVLNLWATWCPPCRREMPVLAQAQQQHADVSIILVNQGEGPDEIRDYLSSEGLLLDNVLLDPFSSVMQEVGSRGLPTTLFFDAKGALVDTHMGELSAASLSQKLQRFDLAPAVTGSPATGSTTSTEMP